ncbi:MAG: phage holin family protein [Anaerolineales bacterium]
MKLIIRWIIGAIAIAVAVWLNGISFWLASWIAVNWFNIGFYVDGLWPAILGSIVVSIVTFLLALLLPDPE